MEGNDHNRGEASRSCGRMWQCKWRKSPPRCPDFERKYPMQSSICCEETATKEDAIKDVQDAQTNLMQACQILTFFYAKVSFQPLFKWSAVLGRASPLRPRFGGPIRNQVGGTNIFCSLRDSSRKPQLTSPKRHALFDKFTGDSGEQWYGQERMSRWGTTRMFFTKWLRKHNRCLPSCKR